MKTTKKTISMILCIVTILTSLVIANSTFLVNAIDGYNASKAIEYARTYCKNYNPNYNSYKGRGGDCANFVSQCLYYGGLQTTNVWKPYTYAWINVGGIYDFLSGLNGTKVIANPDVSEIEPGDVVISGGKGHVTLCIEPGMVASHTTDGTYRIYTGSVSYVIKMYSSDDRDTYNDVFAAKIGKGYSVNQARSAEQTTFQKGDYVYVWGWLHDIDNNLYKSYSRDVCSMTLSIYRPNGSLAHTYTYEDSDNNWIGTKLNVSGTWKIRCQIGGALIGDNERTIKVQAKSVPTYEIDLNGSIDGTKYWGLENFATADVYIDDKLVSNDCNDFYKSYPKGTKYKITDIRAKSGYTYTGAKTISGTLNGNRDITLSFKKSQPSGWSANFRMKSGAYTNAYDGVNGSKVGRVYPGDVVTVKYIYTNGWMKISCPWDGGYNKIVYVKVTAFKFRATKYINAYSGVNSDYVGRVYPDDLVTVKVLYKSGWMKCVCPWDNGTNKTIYVKVGEIY